MTEYLDYLIIAILVFGFILGFKDGLVKKILTLVGCVAAVLIALYFSPQVRIWIIKFLDVKPDIAVIFSFILLFLFFFLISKLIIKLIRPKKSVLGFVDRSLGGILGGFQIGLFLSAILIFLNLFNFPSKEEKEKLKYYEFTYKLLPNTFSFVKKIFPESEAILDLLKEIDAK